jgi:serine protease AprX
VGGRIHAATVPANRVDALRAAPGVTAVTPDGRVTMAGKAWLADSQNTSISSVTKMIGAQDVWTKKDPSGRAAWNGRTWSGRTWSGRTWSGRTWSGGYWSGAIWE